MATVAPAPQPHSSPTRAQAGTLSSFSPVQTWIFIPSSYACMWHHRSQHEPHCGGLSCSYRVTATLLNSALLFHLQPVKKSHGLPTTPNLFIFLTSATTLFPSEVLIQPASHALPAPQTPYARVNYTRLSWRPTEGRVVTTSTNEITVSNVKATCPKSMRWLWRVAAATLRCGI